MKKIKLTKGYEAIVDKEDYERINSFKWCYSAGYAVRGKTLASSYIKMHRMVMDARKGQVVDHINRDKLDNRKSNLRFCSLSDNAQNKKPNKRYKGVYQNKKTGRWQAYIKIQGKQTHLGYFDTPELAALEYNKHVKTHYKEGAYLNAI